ncbi:hypothetical protein NQ315_003152 [Exocentrus adspersus]|uniref:Juvenile hormone binding protein in insects n=1 Tax=Exocentrus adspersus TaxID=1586481 RepID=A0AAV8W5U7_9CUCU|nr:hypothetical protein NQ315_003152 [Exocentrus adspersus]
MKWLKNQRYQFTKNIFRYFIFVLALIQTFYTSVNGNLTICIPTKGNESDVEGDYRLLLTNLKQELSALLDGDSSFFLDHLDFNLDHPAVALKGLLHNVTAKNMQDFHIDFFKDIDIIRNRIEIFNLTFRNVSTFGEYNMTGNIGELFDIWGAGSFWANVYNFSISAQTKIPNITSTATCLFIDVKVTLQKLESWFDNMMDDEELEEIMNGAIMDLATEAVESIWDQLKDDFHGPLQKWIDAVINGNSSHIIARILQMKQNKN